MNGNRIITPAIAIALLLAAALSSSCTREGLIARRGINFKAQSTGFLSPERATKTAYSGLPSEGQQCIEWIDGDVIRVYSPQAFVYEKPSVHEADFRVKSHSNASLISTATITPSADANSLQWGEGTHAFYAMYPTPSGGNTFSEGTMVFTMPATQAPLSSSTSAGTIELVPHMASYAPMLASKTGLDPAANPTVPLAFTPQFTAFEVVINKGAYTTVNLSEFKIKGAEGDKLAGTFTVSAGSYNAVASIADASNVITMDLNGDDEDSTDDLALLNSTNPNLKLTVFTLPQTFSDGITLEFKGSFDGGATVTRRITLKTAGGAFVQFDPYCKYRISGLSFPVVVDATIDDSISWDFSLQIMDGVVWWIGAEAVNNIDWIDDLDFDAYTELRDEVKWFSGAHIEQDFAWEELDHIALSDASDLYLWRTETAQRTVTAVNRDNKAFSDVSASWSCSPSYGVIYLNQSTGEIRAIAPGEAVVTATVTPNDGSTPWNVSYKVYVNAPTGITLTADSDFVRPDDTVDLTAAVTCTSNGTPTAYPADLLEWSSVTPAKITVSGSAQPALATGQAAATATGVAEGTSTLSVSVATKYADGITASLTDFPCEDRTTITFPDWNEDGEPDGEKYKFRGYYLSPGVLYWNGSAYDLTSGSDPLELLQHYYHDGKTNGFDGTTATHTDLNVYYHAWAGTNSLYHRLHGSDNTTPNANITATITVSGQTWKIPTGNTDGDWDKIFTTSLSSISSPNITINGTPKSDASYNYVRITVDLTNATKANGAAENYNLKGLGTGSNIGNNAGNNQYQSGILLIPDGAKISCNKISSIPGEFNSETNCLGWDDLNTLTDGGCVFLPTAGAYSGSSWRTGGLFGYYWSATQNSNTSYAYLLYFNSGNVNATNYDNKSGYMPVRLVRVAE